MKILFTEATSLSARQTLYALRHRASSTRMATIDVLDPDPLSQCRFSSLVRKWTRCPHYAHHPQAFLDFLVHQLQTGGYDVLLPTHEQTILLSRFRESLGRHVGLTLPPHESVMTMQNKATFMRFLGEIGVPHPDTRHIRSAECLLAQTRFPCFLKLGHSTAGAGVHFVHDAEHLRQLADRLMSEGLLNGSSEWIVQDPGQGVLSTVKAVFDRGRPVAIAMYEAREKGLGGMSTARTSAHHPAVFDDVARIGESLNWHGGLFLDYFFEAANNRAQYIEGNPRIGETFNPTLAGINLAESLVRVSAGVALPTFTPEHAGQTGVRTQSFYMILISLAHAGASRKTLFRECVHWLRGSGVYRDSEDDLTRPSEDRWSLAPLLWIATQLLIWPGRAKSIVRKTIHNYSLPEAAMKQLDALTIQ